MCLTNVGQVLSVDDVHGTAIVATGRRQSEISLAPLVLDDQAVTVGDWVLVHTGLAVTVLDEHEAREILDATAALAPSAGPEP
jgi:hydrogenase expression/formation protein HypC